MFCEISGPLSHAARVFYFTEWSTIVDLLIKIPWTSEPCGILNGPQFFQKVQNLSKRSKISNAPLGNLIKNIRVVGHIRV